MKRTSLIVIGVIVVVLLAAVLVMGLLGPSYGSTYSQINRELQAPYPMDAGYGGGAPALPEMPAMMEAPMPTMSPPGFDTANRAAVGYGASPSAAERIIIQNADLAVVVTDVEKRTKEISVMTQEMGGFVVSINLYTSGNVDAPEVTMAIRIPSEKLDEALERIKKDAVDIQYENRSGQDVTDQYVDLQSRLKAKQAAEAKLLEIMENAQTTEDVLAVYQQLQMIQTEIEVLTGQINYLEQSAALSAISIRLISEETVKPVEIGPWRPEGVALEAIQDLVDFSKSFVEFLIRFVLYTLPVLVMVGIPLYLVFIGGRAVYRRLRGNKPRKEPAPPAEKK